MSYISSIGGSWQDSDLVCALATAERHLGHLIKRGRWYAYDATRRDEASRGFRCLGSFSDLVSAKQIVELAVWASPAPSGNIRLQ